MAEATKAGLYLPDEYWENFVKFLIDDPHSLESLSLVSKQLLSITNRFKFSLTICDRALIRPKSLLRRLFRRFPNITSLNLRCFRKPEDLDSDKLDVLLCRISKYPFLKLLKSLKLSIPSRIPAKGFQALSKKHKTSLKSLICSKLVSLNHADLENIPKCFPFLEELDLSLVNHPDPYFTEQRDDRNFNQGIQALSQALPNLRVNFYNIWIFKRNCPLLGEIRMKSTGIGKCNTVKDFDSVNAHHRVKSLHLGRNSWLTDESIKFFASMIPNLELLDLSFCSGISDQGVVEVLRRCLKIRHLNVKSNPRVRLLGMNFQVPKLEVLSMSNSSIDDETLYVISKSCSGLLQLELELCDVTEIGVRLVIENCTKLREINLLSCHKVAADVFAWMLNSRPSLRYILAPLHFRPSHNEMKPRSKYGFMVRYG